MRSYRCSRTWSLISGFALIGLIACATRHRVPSLQTPSKAPSTSDSAIIPASQDAPISPMKPIRYLTKRLGPDGTPADLEYRLAVDRMERMPRYSTRARRFLPSLEDARRLKGSADNSFNRTCSPLGLLLGQDRSAEKTRVLQIHPSKPEVIVSGRRIGGDLENRRRRPVWRAVADLLPNIAVNSLAMNPSNPDVSGTGEGYFRELVRGTGLPLRGEGIFKSEDGRDTGPPREHGGPNFH